MTQSHNERQKFAVQYDSGMAVLIVKPRRDGERPLYADDVSARMRILGVTSVPAKHIREIIERASGEPEPLAPWPEGAGLNAQITVHISADCMEARASVRPPKHGGSPIDARDIRKALDDAGVTRGIDSSAIDRLTAPAGAGGEMVVATGKNAVHARPPQVECLFVTERGKPWKELKDGRMELKELNFIQNRKRGDLLARYIPPVTPVEGFDVTGRILKARQAGGADTLRAGKGVKQTQEGFVADLDGNVLVKNEEICIEPSIFVKDVDYSTGNIDFDGSVTVKGTVADGFTVKASGDIQVGKTLSSACLESGRDTILRGGMVGNRDGQCTAGRDMYAKFLEGASCRVGGDLYITEAILHSKTEVDGHVHVTQGRGEITGGLLVAGKNVDCKRIGNVYSGETRVYVGCTPGDLRSFNDRSLRLKALREEIDDLDRCIDYARGRGADNGKIELLKADHEARVNQTRELAAILLVQRKTLQSSEGISLTIRTQIFNTAKLFFGLEEYALGNAGLRKAVLHRERGKTVLHGYRAESPGV